MNRSEYIALIGLIIAIFEFALGIATLFIGYIRRKKISKRQIKSIIIISIVILAIGLFALFAFMPSQTVEISLSDPIFTNGTSQSDSNQHKDSAGVYHIAIPDSIDKDNDEKLKPEHDSLLAPQPVKYNEWEVQYSDNLDGRIFLHYCSDSTELPKSGPYTIKIPDTCHWNCFKITSRFQVLSPISEPQDNIIIFSSM